jgi:hypothetical protein
LLHQPSSSKKKCLKQEDRPHNPFAPPTTNLLLKKVFKKKLKVIPKNLTTHLLLYQPLENPCACYNTNLQKTHMLAPPTLPSSKKKCLKTEYLTTHFLLIQPFLIFKKVKKKQGDPKRSHNPCLKREISHTTHLLLHQPSIKKTEKKER